MIELIENMKAFTAIEIFTVNDFTLTLGGVIAVILTLVATFFANLIARRGIRRLLARRDNFNPGQAKSISQLARYSIYTAGVATALHMIGFNMGSLLAAGAVFGVAVGFAMQTILQNFVSGIILMAENSVRPGDILEVDDKIVRVEEIRIRSTIVRTLRDEEMILPNSTIVTNAVTNHTLTDSKYRLIANVGVSYDSDLDKTRDALMRAATSSGGHPKVLLMEFGDSSVVFRVSIEIDSPWKKFDFTSELLFAIWNELKASGIVIAYPQLDVHFDEPIASLKRSA